MTTSVRPGQRERSGVLTGGDALESGLTVIGSDIIYYVHVGLPLIIKLSSYLVCTPSCAE